MKLKTDAQAAQLVEHYDCYKIYSADKDKQRFRFRYQVSTSTTLTGVRMLSLYTRISNRHVLSYRVPLLQESDGGVGIYFSESIDESGKTISHKYD